MLSDEYSILLDNVRDELKFDLGPSLAIVPKLMKQIERMTKIRDDFLRTEQEKQLWPVSCIPCRNIRRLIQQEQLAFWLHYLRFCRRPAARTVLVLELAPLYPRKSSQLGVH